MADERAKTKVKKKGYFFSTLLLFFLFIFLLFLSIIFLDVIGFLNLTKIIPMDSQLGRTPYVGRYLKYSYEMHLTDQEKVKLEADKYQELLEVKRRELELKEGLLKKLEEDLKKRETELKTAEETAEKLNKELDERQKKVEELEKEYTAKTENIDKFANVYSKMSAQAAARFFANIDDDVAAQILEKMEEKKIAVILEGLANQDIEKAKQIVEKMTVRKNGE